MSFPLPAGGRRLTENIVYFELRRCGYAVYIGKNEAKGIDFAAARRAHLRTGVPTTAGGIGSYGLRCQQRYEETGVKAGADARFDKGLAKQVALFGEGMAKVQTDGPAARRNVNRWLADNCFGDYYTRTGLNDQEREMITFCFLLAQGGCENQLRGHTRGNLGVGNDKTRLYAFVEQCMPYIGYPRTLNAMNIVDEVTAQ